MGERRFFLFPGENSHERKDKKSSGGRRLGVKKGSGRRWPCEGKRDRKQGTPIERQMIRSPRKTAKRREGKKKVRGGLVVVGFCFVG